MCVRSTLRRNAMATPASVHYMSRQLVFGDLSCIWFKKKTCPPPHHEHFTIHRIISHWIVCSSCSSWVFWIWAFWSYRFGSNQDPPKKTVASHQSCFPSVSCRCCTRCSLCTQLCNRSIVNPSSPSGSTHRFFFATSEPLEQETFVIIPDCNSTHRSVLSNNQQWLAHRNLQRTIACQT